MACDWWFTRGVVKRIWRGWFPRLKNLQLTPELLLEDSVQLGDQPPTQLETLVVESTKGSLKAIARDLPWLTSLTSLKVALSGSTEEEERAWISGLTNLRRLRSMELKTDRIRHADSELLSEKLRPMTHLVKLSLSGMNDIRIFEDLRRLTKLETLALESQGLDSIAVDVLGESLRQLGRLRKLDLNFTGPTAVNFRPLVKNLHSLTGLTSLCLRTEIDDAAL